jgi:hypothetical protein
MFEKHQPSQFIHFLHDLQTETQSSPHLRLDDGALQELIVICERSKRQRLVRPSISSWLEEYLLKLSRGPAPELSRDALHHQKRDVGRADQEEA